VAAYGSHSASTRSTIAEAGLRGVSPGDARDPRGDLRRRLEAAVLLVRHEPGKAGAHGSNIQRSSGSRRRGHGRAHSPRGGPTRPDARSSARCMARRRPRRASHAARPGRGQASTSTSRASSGLAILVDLDLDGGQFGEEAGRAPTGIVGATAASSSSNSGPGAAGVRQRATARSRTASPMPAARKPAARRSEAETLARRIGGVRFAFGIWCRQAGWPRRPSFRAARTVVTPSRIPSRPHRPAGHTLAPLVQGGLEAAAELISARTEVSRSCSAVSGHQPREISPRTGRVGARA